MKRLLLLPLLLALAGFISLLPVHANTEFELYMHDFYKKQEMASKLLKEVETDLKKGASERVCARQRKAANYGVEATESLIKAFKVSGNAYQTDDIKAGLNKWRELRDNC
ncbi:hypothetical protein [Prochlorococcus sp. MIT 1223]|uniref:hypothetical protein n=1 Tax=Prochlorococcus sp. MIT 1223 TaxID=3096217 RepID=UPI002A75ACE0|nr:hypothetical protein [Prochlorococcus sp. MIT 1223]